MRGLTVSLVLGLLVLALGGACAGRPRARPAVWVVDVESILERRRLGRPSEPPTDEPSDSVDAAMLSSSGLSIRGINSGRSGNKLTSMTPGSDYWLTIGQNSGRKSGLRTSEAG